MIRTSNWKPNIGYRLCKEFLELHNNGLRHQRRQGFITGCMQSLIHGISTQGGKVTKYN